MADTTLLTPDDLCALVDLGREVAAEVNFPRLVRSILDKAAHLTDSQKGSVILVDRRRGGLYFADAIGDESHVVLERWGLRSTQRIPIDGSKAGTVLTTGRSLVDGSVVDDPNHFKGVDAQLRTTTETMICVPLTAMQDRFGVVQLLNKKNGLYTEHDRVLLEHFASYAAVALRNARLFEDLIAHMGYYAEPSDDEGPLQLLQRLREPAREERLSVLFADMRGFTQLCHVVGRPEHSQSLLNDFLSMLCDCVLEQGGVVNKFLGDGVMALFRGEGHEIAAVRAAGAIVEQFDALRGRWNDTVSAPLDFVDVGVGVATDRVLLGAIGSERVRDFTAIGTAVNIAGYLADNARGGKRIWLDKLTFHAAKSVVAESDPPEMYEIRKTGQQAGPRYERHHVRRVVSARAPGGDASVPPSTPSAAPRAPSPPMSSQEPKSPPIFISYSHQDAPWLKKLQKHLKPYTRQSTMSVWDDTKLRVGDRWRDEIEKALATAKAAVLLVSPDFLESDFVMNNELPPLLAKAKERGVKIYWIPISASAWQTTELKNFQASFDPKRPLAMMTDPEQDQALADLCAELGKALVG